MHRGKFNCDNFLRRRPWAEIIRKNISWNYRWDNMHDTMRGSYIAKYASDGKHM